MTPLGVCFIISGLCGCDGGGIVTGDLIIVTVAGSLPWLLPLLFPEYTESDTDLIYAEALPPLILTLPGDDGDTKELLDIDGGVVVAVPPSCPKAPLATILCWSSTNGTLTVLSKICLCLNVVTSSVVPPVYNS